jgi:DNA-binding transcriptional ArsR family regulator
MREARRVVVESDEIRALAHPLRLDLLGYLMSAGPATASTCARAIGDTPSNCSYHLRVLARHDLVVDEESTDGRERPWRALITGLEVPDDGTDSVASAYSALALQRDQRLARDFLAKRARLDPAWHAAAGHATYGLRISPAEMAALGQRLDALIRPYIAATRDDAPADAAIVQVGIQAIPIDAALFGDDQ